MKGKLSEFQIIYQISNLEVYSCKDEAGQLYVGWDYEGRKIHVPVTSQVLKSYLATNMGLVDVLDQSEICYETWGNKTKQLKSEDLLSIFIPLNA